jgi:hypothetical protein
LAGLGGQWSFLGGWLNKEKQMPILAQVYNLIQNSSIVFLALPKSKI